MNINAKTWYVRKMFTKELADRKYSWMAAVFTHGKYFFADFTISSGPVHFESVKEAHENMKLVLKSFGKRIITLKQ